MTKESPKRELDPDLPEWAKHPVLRASKVAEILDCTVHTVRNMLDDDRLQGINLGTADRPHRRILTASLIKYIKLKIFRENRENRENSKRIL